MSCDDNPPPWRETIEDHIAVCMQRQWAPSWRAPERNMILCQEKSLNFHNRKKASLGSCSLVHIWQKMSQVSTLTARSLQHWKPATSIKILAPSMSISKKANPRHIVQAWLQGKKGIYIKICAIKWKVRFR